MVSVVLFISIVLYNKDDIDPVGTPYWDHEIPGTDCLEYTRHMTATSSL